jgi:uncharacterized protein YndB with AHSA1/START domain
MRSTRVSQHVDAPRELVYRLLIDPDAIAAWKVPDEMTCHVHAFEPRVGGTFRISLTYDAGSSLGKTGAHTDTYYGRFVELVPNERIVEVDEFETADPGFQGEMTITITLIDKGGGTEIVGVHEAIPPGVSIADNEAGWRMALAKLATLAEAKARI